MHNHKAHTCIHTCTTTHRSTHMFTLTQPHTGACTCSHMHNHTGAHTCSHFHNHSQARTCSGTVTQVHACAHRHNHTYACTLTYESSHMCSHVRVQAHADTPTHMHTHSYAHTHTHTPVYTLHPRLCSSKCPCRRRLWLPLSAWICSHELWTDCPTSVTVSRKSLRGVSTRIPCHPHVLQ